jgi:hypothetical protein
MSVSWLDLSALVSLLIACDQRGCDVWRKILGHLIARHFGAGLCQLSEVSCLAA